MATPLVDVGDALTWLKRAAQARRIAAMLSGRDAQMLESYAAECERACGNVAARGMDFSIAITGAAERRAVPIVRRLIAA